MNIETKLLNFKGKLIPFQISYDIEIGDIVWNISHGGREHPEDFDIAVPAVMLDLFYSNYKPYECRTNLGFGPKEHYFKIIDYQNKRFKLMY